jgi:hypothetical protein
MRWNVVILIVVSLVVTGLGSGITGEVKPRTRSNMSPAQSPGIKIYQGMTYILKSNRTIMFGGIYSGGVCNNVS